MADSLRDPVICPHSHKCDIGPGHTNIGGWFCYQCANEVLVMRPGPPPADEVIIGDMRITYHHAGLDGISAV